MVGCRSKKPESGLFGACDTHLCMKSIPREVFSKHTTFGLPLISFSGILDSHCYSECGSILRNKTFSFETTIREMHGQEATCDRPVYGLHM